MSSKSKKQLLLEPLKLREAIFEGLQTQYVARQDPLAFVAEDLDPRSYSTAEELAIDLAYYSFLRKYEDGGDARSLTIKALLDFETVERGNQTLNRRIRSGHLQFSADVESVIFHARRKIAQILGVFSYDKVDTGCTWGPGTTATLKGAAGSTRDKKISEFPFSASSTAWRHFQRVVKNDYHWGRSVGLTADGPFCFLDCCCATTNASRLTTVPKSLSARRVIDIQPTINLFLQKGVGSYVRHRLKRYGVDLDDQSRNQELARIGVEHGLATVDLKNASNTVSQAIVELLLPIDWVDHLRDLRTEFTIFPDGSRKYLEMFSAMGNGYTFELESLIFYSLLHAIRSLYGLSGDTISVYGDDLICPIVYKGILFDVLTACGFTVNDEKSFFDGGFRESCGVQTFFGRDITPVFQKEAIRDLQSCIRASNRVLRLGSMLGFGLFIDSRVSEGHALILRHASQFTKSVKKFYGPTWLEGDSFIKQPFFMPQADENGVFFIHEYRFVPRKIHGDGMSLLADYLRSNEGKKDSINESSASLGMVTPRGLGKYLVQKRRCYDDLSREALHPACWVTSLIKSDEMI